jgi:hypothetical protein
MHRWLVLQRATGCGGVMPWVGMEEGNKLRGNLATDPCLKVIHALAKGVLKTRNGVFQASEAQVKV